MGTRAHAQVGPDVAYEDRVIRKTFRYLMTFLFILFLIAMLDRVNIGFAALSMNRDLKLTAMMFGLASTISYIGYVAFEIPSNLCLRRYGARVWLARIAISWGLASVATMFAVGPKSLYSIRFLVGVFEAGFLPGVFLYLTYWFPPTFRARATALFAIAQPLTVVVGASVSGLILQHLHAIWGLAGWRWLFLLEGTPAVLLGVVTYFYLSDGPADARWLKADERAALQRRLQREQSALPPQHTRGKAWRDLFSRHVIIMVVTYFCLVTSLNSTATWTPLIIRDFLKGRSLSYVGMITAIPSALSVIAMVIWGSHSDKKMERTWHYAASVLLACLGWAMVAASANGELKMLGLIFATTGTQCGFTIFWTIPPSVLTAAARPVGIAFTSMCGMFAAILAPVIFGFLRDFTHSWAASVLYVALMLLISGSLIHLVPVKEKAAAMLAPARTQAAN